MAGTGSDPQKQLLNLIRNFAYEKSQGERRVVTLRKQFEDLKSELCVATAEVENAKRFKELVEQELKGFEVHLSMIEASVQTLEARVSLIQDEISAVGSDLETLKNEEAALREQFINNMLELNAKIRKFQEAIITCNIDAVDEEALRDAPQVIVKENDAEVALRALESTLLEILSQTAKEEEEYQEEHKIYKNVQQELIDWERKVSLMNMIVTETKALQNLTLYPYTFESGSIFGSLPWWLGNLNSYNVIMLRGVPQLQPIKHSLKMYITSVMLIGIVRYHIKSILMNRKVLSGSKTVRGERNCYLEAAVAGPSVSLSLYVFAYYPSAFCFSLILYQTTYSSLGVELQRRCLCPSCHLDNLEAVSELLQANEEK
ncbi:hypothetical protein RIF29_14431 [Crotalaria pallida]|uniref:Uncharacterized protein n=1 Tax=Crotalaria pallida TaxID=3830 RepID=A0AAN9IBL8_CROPI